MHASTNQSLPDGKNHRRTFNSVKGTPYKKNKHLMPKNIAIIIILGLVFFSKVSSTSTTIWVSIFINEATCGSGIFKIFVLKSSILGWIIAV
jgi:hypothetical protein